MVSVSVKDWVEGIFNVFVVVFWIILFVSFINHWVIE